MCWFKVNRYDLFFFAKPHRRLGVKLRSFRDSIPTATTVDYGQLVNMFRRNKNSFAHNAHLNTGKGLWRNIAKCKRINKLKMD